MYLENNQSARHPIRPFFAWVFVALWMLIIFLLSAQDGTASGQLSNGLAAWLYRLLTGQTDPGATTAFEAVLRSFAHGGAYFILALFLEFAFERSGIQDIRNALLTLLICALYAGSDEWHQAFVPGRACEFIDFAIDMAGSILGIALYQGISAISFMRRQKCSRDEGS